MMNNQIERASQIQTVTQFTDKGSVQLREKQERIRKPAWLVVAKLIGVVALIGIGLVMIPAQFPFLEGRHPVLITSILMLIYTLAAHFLHPKANMDNLGIMGDDMFQYNDDINRNLLAWNVFLGPGRFVSDTVFDALVLMEFVPERTLGDIHQAAQQKVDDARAKRHAEIEARVAAQRAAEGSHGIELDSAKYFNMAAANSGNETSAS